MLKIKYCYQKNKLVFLSVGLGIVIRIILFIVNLVWVDGLHIDETMTVLNAYSLANHSTDILGNSMPIYFTTWITGGQSPVATYLCALSVKLFGQTLFAVRLPALLVGIIGLLVFSKFANDLFGDNDYSRISVALVSFSPWFIFSSVYVLDCNFLAYMLIFAMCIFVRAVKARKTIYFVLSMLFFSLGFYSYMASVLTIPFLLLALYGLLLWKRQIRFTDAVVSVLSMIVFSLPFILFGLVSINVLPEFEVCGISFCGMEEYDRAASVALSANGGVFSIISQLAENLLLSTVLLFFTDYSGLDAVGPNMFQYGNCLSGVLLIIGLVRLFFVWKNKSKRFNTLQKAMFLSSAIGTLTFCALVNDVSFAYEYRYGVLSFYLILFEALGLKHLISFFKKDNIKSIVSIYLALSFVLYAGEFFVRYSPQTDNTPDIIYGDSLLDCLDYYSDNDIDKVNIISSDYGEQRKTSIYLRYYYGTDSLINFRDEYDLRKCGTKAIDASDNITLYVNYDGFRLTQQNYIISDSCLKQIENYSEYNVSDYGNFCILSKK